MIAELRDTDIPVLAVDAPSSWNIETGPPDNGPGKGFHPGALISLTAPKPLVKWFKGRHFLGGRYVDCFVTMRSLYSLGNKPLADFSCHTDF